ncbi:MAG: hypothetical protein JWO13_433 [Acidobacteriales bacterium]|nr:hypothetical protein [Terriglobales bacterium]
MSGNNQKGFVLQERDLQLFREMPLARIVDRKQAMLLGNFTSTTRINARLLKLAKHGFFTRYRLGTQAGGTKYLYALTTKAAVTAQVQAKNISRKPGSVLAGDLFVAHQLHLNDILIAVKRQPLPVDCQFIRWISFPNPLSKSVPLTPDGYFELNTRNGIRAVFIEADLGTESRKIWAAKIRHYLQLATTGEFENLFKHSQFRVLIATTSQRRLESIRQVISKHTRKLFFLSTFDTINQHGLWSPLWLRPEGDERQSLL